MKEKTRQKEIDKILLNMAMYYGHELVPDVINIYHELLAGHSYQDINAACGIWMKENQWFPKANEIIGIIEKNKGPQVSIEARAQQQWRIVMTAVRRRGLNQGAPIFTDPITANLIRTQFSWPYLCKTEEKNGNWEQKRWCEAFELAIEAHPDMKQIKVPANVKDLAANVTKPVTESAPTAPHTVPTEVIAQYRQKYVAKIITEEQREARITELKEQARQIQEEGGKGKK